MKAFKKCPSCNILKTRDNFHINKKNGNLTSYCHDCVRIKSREKYRRDPKRGMEIKRAYDLKNPTVKRNAYLKHYYGITFDQYEEKNKNQNGLCAICNKPEKGTHSNGRKVKRLSVDHCHKTQKVRDLLCFTCNIKVGFMENEPELVMPILRYLKRHA